MAGSLAEAVNAKGPMAADLAAGVNMLSATETVTFVPYVRVVSPLDGYVWWAKSTTLTPVNVQGSLHYATELTQVADSTIGYDTILFTALSPVDIFSQENPQVLYIADYEGVVFAFSARNYLYQQADLYHYTGTALSATFATQIVDNISDIDLTAIIVSNSLPIWLLLPSISSPFLPFVCPIPLYASFLVPNNLLPPYGAVHIDPERTEALSSSPHYDATLGSTQSMKDCVTLTLYGCSNAQAKLVLDAVLQFCYYYGTLGLMNMPAIRDEKKAQVEFQVLAQKKTIYFEVSYVTSVARAIARELIQKAAIAAVVENPFPVAGPFSPWDQHFEPPVPPVNPYP